MTATNAKPPQIATESSSDAEILQWLIELLDTVPDRKKAYLIEQLEEYYDEKINGPRTAYRRGYSLGFKKGRRRNYTTSRKT